MEQQQQLQTSTIVSGGGFFKMFSHVCVYNPFEVLVALGALGVTLYVISTSPAASSVGSSNSPSTSSFLFYNFAPPPPPPPHHLYHQALNATEDGGLAFSSAKSRFNFWFITTLRLIAFICVLIQFKNQLKKLKSKMVISASITMAIITSYLLSRALIEYYSLDAVVSPLLIFDTAIYTIVIIDLKKCHLIFSSACEQHHYHRDAVKASIVHSVADFMSKSCLDTFFFTLLMALGNLSELNEIKQMSMFGCLLLMCNYVVFMCVYPALLSLTLQFVKTPVSTTKSKLVDKKYMMSTHAPLLQQQLSSTSSSSSLKLLTNPVLVYVKVLMTLFLVMVHLKSKFFEQAEPSSTITTTTPAAVQVEEEQTSFDSQYIFYTECVLLATLNIYILSKLLIIDSSTSTSSSSSVKPASPSMATQTEEQEEPAPRTEARSLDECLRLFTHQQRLDDFLDSEVIDLVHNKHVPVYKLETYFRNPARGVRLRRLVVERNLSEQAREGLAHVPYEHYEYERVIGTCCENIVGYVPLPLGLAGPLLVDGKPYYLPMATTEGTLVASTNRGCNALNSGGRGVSTKLISNAMTRAPVLRLQSGMRAVEVKEWQETNFALLKSAFDSTSNFAKLESIKCCVAGRLLYMRFAASTCDAMGMNMLSKGSESALNELKKHFPDAQVVSLSGNYCTDKKPSAINWIEGRGKWVLCEAIVPGHVVKSVLKTSVSALVELNISKNLVGSAMAGAMGGGFNAHAANIVAAMYIACGQDPAQVVEGCNCMTLMEQEGEDLYISCTMPSLEVGTVGGGTNLDAQASCLKLLGVQGSNAHHPGENASRLARVIASAVLAGELSLMSALAAGHLVNSHMKYNRSAVPLNPQQTNIHGVI